MRKKQADKAAEKKADSIARERGRIQAADKLRQWEDHERTSGEPSKFLDYSFQAEFSDLLN